MCDLPIVQASVMIINSVCVPLSSNDFEGEGLNFTNGDMFFKFSCFCTILNFVSIK